MPSIAIPIRDILSGYLSRRVCRIELTGAQKRVLSLRGADFRAALNVYGDADPRVQRCSGGLSFK